MKNATAVDVQSNSQSSPINERLRLHYDGYTAVLTQGDAGNHWLLTGWEDDNKTSEGSATREVRDSPGATATTPILTRRNGGNFSDSDSSIASYIDNFYEDYYATIRNSRKFSARELATKTERSRLRMEELSQRKKVLKINNEEW